MLKFAALTFVFFSAAAPAADWVVTDWNEDTVTALEVVPSAEDPSIRQVAIMVGSAEPEKMLGSLSDMMVIHADLDCAGKRLRTKSVVLKLSGDATTMDEPGEWRAASAEIYRDICERKLDKSSASQAFETPEQVLAEFRKTAVPACATETGRADAAALRKLAGAKSRKWYLESAGISVAGKNFEKFGSPRELAKHEVEFYSETDGVLFVAEAGYSADAEIVYALVDRATCSFQPYQLVVGE